MPIANWPTPPSISRLRRCSFIGSILFFNEATTYLGTWLFLIGSVLFGMRPTIKLIREIAYLRVGNYQDITET